VSKISEVCKCLDHEDKKLILRIIDGAITRENMELRKIENRKLHILFKPQFVESFLGISSSLVRTRQEFKKNMESLKQRIEEYSVCVSAKPPIAEIGYNVKLAQAEITVPYSQRKLK
jgi:hypothetical protein